jgi:hypothetical protein
MAMKEKITDFYGKIIGWVTTEANGNKTVTDFYGKILGYYDKKLNITTDFYRKKLSNGDTAVGLIWANKNK